MAIILNGTTGITTPDITSTTSTLGALTQALDLGSTGQVVFPATQNASANANTLDDYEEGTWTPSITLSSGTATAPTVLGTYTKTGRQVTLTLSILFTTTSAAAIDTVGGYPFAVRNAGDQAIGVLRENANTGFVWQLRANSNATFGLCRRYDNIEAIADDFRFIGSLTYFV